MAFATSLTPNSGYVSTYIDSLIWGCQWTNSSGSYGTGSTNTPIVISYSFGSGNFVPGLDIQNFGIYSGFGNVWTNSETATIDLALQKLVSVCNVSFVKSNYTTRESNQTNIVLYKETYYSSQEGFAGYAEVPDGLSGYFGSYNIYLNNNLSTWTNLTPGSYGFYTVIHELGHSLGLAHPHDGGDQDPTIFPGVTSSSSEGQYAMNQGIWTMMSYNSDWTSQPAPSNLSYGSAMGPMALDIAALQRIYGANTNFATGNDIYYLPASNNL